MNNSISERVEKIKREHIELLEMAREGILQNRENFMSEVEDVITVLDYDQENVKKYTAMKEAQELIATLTQQIVEAKDVEEIVALRKKLNYYINKIKAELKRREASPEILEQYQEKATYLRKEIAGYIRFLKREDNIAQIETLSSRYDQLSLEEADTLKKCLRREVNYNTRNKKARLETKQTVEKEKSVEEQLEEFDVVDSGAAVAGATDTAQSSDIVFAMDTPVQDESAEDRDRQIEEIISEFGRGEVPQQDKFSFSFADVPEILLAREDQPYEEKVSFEEADSSLQRAAKGFEERYDIQPTLDYHRHGIGRNILHFFRNLPAYFHNKRAIQMMEKDYYLYYSGSDLASYMAYLKRRNSIKQGLKCIFNRSYLYTNEFRYLNHHDKCSKWMYDFCVRNSMPIDISKKESFSI